jgi:peptidoglycan/xylan/chitin deacetylase (PgdA/CDA1 family)
MRRLLAILLLMAASPLHAQPTGQRFPAISFHDVVDKAEDLEADSVTTRTLAQFFDWLKGNGWTPISMDDLAAANRGQKPLPDKAILLTFDDGYASLYTRVFPLLKIYRYPAVSALVGGWMEERPDGKVLYGDKTVPRSTFVSWAEAREMQASGLVEFGSHSYDLHRGVLANPQGNLTPAAITWAYDKATGKYETDAQFKARIRADLAKARGQIAAHLGHAPRTLIWPYGRNGGPALDVAKELGFRFAFTLEAEPAYTSDLFTIHRYFPTHNPPLGEIVSNLAFEPRRPRTRRIACVELDELAKAPPGAAQDEALGRMIEGLNTLGPTGILLDVHAALPSPDAPLGDVFFPTSLRPMRVDLVSRVAWQVRNRIGVNVYLHLPLAAATAALGEANVPRLYGDLARHTVSDGLVLDMPALPESSERDPFLFGEIRARRAALDIATLQGPARLAMQAYRATKAIDPRQRLLLSMPSAQGPPPWADTAVMPPTKDVSETVALATQLRAQGWFRPDVVGRVVFTLPADPTIQVEAMRQAQRLGASAFALCPHQPPLPPSAELAATFSGATYPYRR